MKAPGPIIEKESTAVYPVGPDRSIEGPGDVAHQ